uniref:NADH dehydrogenase [ubiquinone] 1 beta subcomplex subunit 2, mitochondrial n=1 Tax=Equus asinus TaxID=9793 RepID=A0A8C4PLL1_EQUAS
MSSLTRVAPFVRLGGRLFLGRRVRAAGGGGVRHAGGDVHIQPRYRQFPQLTRSQVIQAEFFSATMWFWILWRFWHDSDAVLVLLCLYVHLELMRTGLVVQTDFDDLHLLVGKAV